MNSSPSAPLSQDALIKLAFTQDDLFEDNKIWFESLQDEGEPFSSSTDSRSNNGCWRPAANKTGKNRNIQFRKLREAASRLWNRIEDKTDLLQFPSKTTSSNMIRTLCK